VPLPIDLRRFPRLMSTPAWCGVCARSCQPRHYLQCDAPQLAQIMRGPARRRGARGSDLVTEPRRPQPPATVAAEGYGAARVSGLLPGSSGEAKTVRAPPTAGVAGPQRLQRAVGFAGPNHELTWPR
jgi:hypothetical protein